MKTVRLGRTELQVSKTAFGALPIQRISRDAAVTLVRRAVENGVNFFDTANAYTDSEEKLGHAFRGIRHNVIIATKSGGTDYKTVIAHIEQSLRSLQTDYIDLFQFHNPAVLPNPEDPDGPYAAARKMQELGYVRHIGLTNHRLAVAQEAVASGNFETLQFPFSYLASSKEVALVQSCADADVGFIAMKGLCGGLLNHADACHAFMQQHENVVPIWGVQHEWELDQWLALAQNDVQMTPELEAIIAKDRQELAGNFCRSCGYCLPCAADIDIPQAARMAMLLRRMPYQPFMSDTWHAKMQKISECIHCNACSSRCPYELDTPTLLQFMLKDYNEFYAIHHNDK